LSNNSVRNVPATAKEVERPRARKSGPDFPPVAADDITTGTNGQTQGDMIPITPAINASGIDVNSRDIC